MSLIQSVHPRNLGHQKYQIHQIYPMALAVPMDRMGVTGLILVTLRNDPSQGASRIYRAGVGVAGLRVVPVSTEGRASLPQVPGLHRLYSPVPQSSKWAKRVQLT